MSTRLLNIISNDYDVDPYFNNVVLLTNFDNNIIDYSYNPLSGTNVNAVTFSNSTYKFGTHSAYFVSTSSQYITYPDSSKLEMGSGDFTLESWVYITGYTSANNWGVMGKGGSPSVGGIRFGIHNTGAVDFRIGDGIEFHSLIDTVFKVPLNQWAHVSGCRVGNMLYTSVNGVVSSKQITMSGSIPDTTSLWSIGIIPSTASFFNGFIDSVRVTKGIARYTSNFTPPINEYTVKDLYFNYVKTLLHCNSLPVSDSARTFLYYTNNRATLDTSIKRFGSASYYFNTTNTSSITTTDPVNLGTGDFTIECFFYPTQSQATTAAIICSNAVGATGNWQISCTSSNKLQYYKSASALITSINSYNLNSWNHMAIVRQSGTSYMYLNGVLEISTSNTDDYNLNQGLRIGLNRGGTAYFVGNIDEIRVTIGVARYTTNFNVPVNEFPNQ